MAPGAAQPSLPAVRVVVTDDSGFMRGLLSSALRGRGIEVVGTAHDGDEALELCRRLRPDVMTLDLAMPGLDGIGVLRALRAPGSPEVPVVVVSSFSPEHGVRAVDALAEGAFDLVAKPQAGRLAGFCAELADKVVLAAHSRRNGRAPAVAPPPRRELTPPPARSRPVAALGRRTRRVVVIACSTGGPRALAELLPALPGELGNGTAIVQHMPAGFTAPLAARLNRASRLTVREAAGGETLAPDLALIAPGGSHLRLNGSGRWALSDEPAVGGLRPRADLTIADIARRWGERVVLVVLTGMGSDGLEGAREVRRRGGRVLAEAEETCTVYGMPRAVAEAGLADEVLPLGELAEAIVAEAGA